MKSSCLTLSLKYFLSLPLGNAMIYMYMVTNGPKNFGRIIEGFFSKKMYGGFSQAAEKKLPRYRGGRITEVAVMRGSTVDSY